MDDEVGGVDGARSQSLGDQMPHDSNRTQIKNENKETKEFWQESSVQYIINIGACTHRPN